MRRRPDEDQETKEDPMDVRPAGPPSAAAEPEAPHHAPHAASTVAVLEALGTGRGGLTDAEAEARLGRYGPNRLPEPPRPGALKRFLLQFKSLLIYVLLGAAAVTALLGHVIDSAVILAVVLVNAAIGYVQEGKAERALDAIRHMLAPKASVLRGGHRQTVPGEALVPGDVVVLEAGDRVPADLRLFEARSLKVDEAVLTGESLAVDKTTDRVAADAALGDRRGMAFSGTLVAAGHGRGVVTATGAASEIGRISGLIAGVETQPTPLVRQMGVFARWLTVFILGAAVVILVLGLWLGGYAFGEIFMAVVGLSVAAIPEGLPAILTVTLAIGVQGMARRNAIVRRLPAIEALGSVTTICSDKTGTLTKNEMTVAAVALAEREIAVGGVGYDPHGGFLDARGGDLRPEAVPTLVEIARAGALCNDAALHMGERGCTVEGDPMEGALLTLAAKAGLDLGYEREARPRVDVIPFDSQHRFMATLHHDHEGHAVALIKGAPERLLEMASLERTAAGDAAVDPELWHRRVAHLAAQGQRVLAIAVKPMPQHSRELDFADVESGLVLLGLFGLIDPPREEAIAAVAECKAAGIRVRMITGDHAGTAQAIARQLGLERADAVVTGAEIDRLDEAALVRRASEADVFARTSPEHKLRLVEALQAGGQVAAMTGDGVNDAPALKRADVGIAMGGRGSEAAKEAAEIVLADDNFASIAAAVRAGRTVYDNLKKAILFLLPVNGGESVALVLAILLGLALPIAPVQILWVNMVSSVGLAMALAFEPPEPQVMRRPPRAPGTPILSSFLIWRIVLVSALFAGGIFGGYELAVAQGADLETARTVAVNTLVAMEIFYLFSVRYLHGSSLTRAGVQGTRAVLIAVAVVALLQVAFTYLPVMHLIFDTRPLAPLFLVQALATGILVLLILEAEKALARRLRR
jgi:magnesium-transporting ATPase (P-type)